jgi:hypothetical protein
MLQSEGAMTRQEMQDEIEAIEARPLSRAERDRLQAPLLAALRLERLVDHVKHHGFSGGAST